jgi:hypothetical protein
MSRRDGRAGAAGFWRALGQRLRDRGSPPLVSFRDSKPHAAGGPTTGPEAGRGPGAGPLAKGSPLHAVRSTRPMPEARDVAPLDGGEEAVAKGLIGHLRDGGYLLADGHHAVSYLDAAAYARGDQLVAPYRKAKRPGRGKHDRGPHRLRSLQLLQGAFGAAPPRARAAVERWFGNATAFGGGVAGLPARVRGRDRVRTWVRAKLLINGVRIAHG